MGFITYLEVKCIKTIAQRLQGEKWVYTGLTFLHYTSSGMSLEGKLWSVKDISYNP